MPEFDPIEERLPEGLKPTLPCPPLKLLLAHQQGVLPDEAASEIAGHLEHCGLCRTLLADIEHLSPPGLSEREQELMRRRMPMPAEVDSTKWRWYAVAAAVAAMLLVTAFVGLRSRPAQPVQTAQTLQPKQPEAATPKPEQPQIEVAKLAPPLNLAPGLVLRGSGGPSDQPSTDQLTPAFDAYDKNDYSLAAERFDLLAKEFPRAGLPMLYLGVTQLLMEDDPSALTSLTRADNLATGDWKDAATWYHAVAAVRNHSPEASDLLHDLCRRDKSTYAKQACALEEKR